MARARRTLTQLGALTDRELRDIGLSRTDLRAANALPRDADPAPFLAARVRERASARRAVARGMRT